MRSEKLDAQILHMLEGEPSTARELSEKLSLPYSSVNYRLKVGERRGHIQAKWAGRRGNVYHLCHKGLYGARNVRVLQGKEFYTGSTYLWRLPKGSCVYNLTGSEVARWSYRTVPASYIIAHQKKIKRKQLVIRTITHPKNRLDAALFHSDVLKEFLDRTVGRRVVMDAEAFSGSGEIIISKKWILLCNYPRKQEIIIHDPVVVSMLYQIMEWFYHSQEEPLTHTRLVNAKADTVRILKEK